MPPNVGHPRGYSKRSSRNGFILQEVAVPGELTPLVKLEDKPGNGSALGVEDGKDL